MRLSHAISASLSTTLLVVAEELTPLRRDQIPFLHFAYDGYEEPSYFIEIERLMGADYIKRCVKREFPPEVGTLCRSRPKACFWGEQICDGDSDIKPTTRCNCHDGRWTSCQEYNCPTISAECPVDDPETMSPVPVCRKDLTCFYEEQSCCGVSFSPKWCTCEAGQPFDCGRSDLCRTDSSCNSTVGAISALLSAGTSRFPSDFRDLVFPGGGGGGGGGANGAMCDGDQQDCPDGFKCTTDDIFLDQVRCRPLVNSPDQVGDSCSELGDNDGDSCDVDGICLGGVCRGLDIDGTQCALSETSHFYPSGIRICEESCDPILAASCNVVPGSHCTRSAGSPDGIFSCFISESNILGGFADSCVETVQCQQGSICLQSDSVPFGYCNGGATNCCVPLCDLSSDGPAFCEGLGNLFECRSIYNGGPPPGLEHVGACLLI